MNEYQDPRESARVLPFGQTTVKSRLNPEEADRETGYGLLNPERIDIVC